MVIGRMHGVEALLTGCVPEVNRNLLAVHRRGVPEHRQRVCRLSSISEESIAEHALVKSCAHELHRNTERNKRISVGEHKRFSLVIHEEALHQPASTRCE